MTAPLIELAGIGKDYVSGWRRRPFTALRDVSFSVGAGEAFGFIGENGAGKSTTIKILVGAIQASQGEARMQGLPVTDPRSRQRVGYVPENPTLFDYLTPLEILTMSAQLHGIRRHDLRRHCLAVLAQLSIADVANKRIRLFSKGMTQRVAIAQAIVCEPKLLILDEPLSGLDPVGRIDVVSLLAGYLNSGGTIFFSSHVLHDVERLADRFGLVHKGELRTIYTPTDLVHLTQGQYRLRSYSPTPLAGAEPLKSGQYVMNVSREQLAAAISDIQAQGGNVLEVKPAKTLEQFFLDLTRG